MREFTEQFFDLLLDLDANWRVTTVRSNYKDREVFIDIEHVGKQACCPKTFDLCGVYDHAPKRKMTSFGHFGLQGLFSLPTSKG